VKLFSREDARWYSEGLPDRAVGYEDMVTFPRQDLENVYYEQISEWKIYYKVLQADGTWGGEVFQDRLPRDVAPGSLCDGCRGSGQSGGPLRRHRIVGRVEMRRERSEVRFGLARSRSEAPSPTLCLAESLRLE